MRSVLGKNKKILVAPLNWGLGHATRCIPIINSLIKNNFEPVIASDGIALKFLQMEFPDLKFFELPSYNIEYAKNRQYLKYKLLFHTPKILKSVFKEKQVVAEIIEKENIKGIISDNRFGVRSTKVPSIYVSHQIHVLSGNSTWLTSKLHQNIIAKFDECWVPDYKGPNSLAGKLVQNTNKKLNLKYIGPISRFEPFYSNEKTKKKKHNLLVLLSGPEPQRSYLETKLLNELKTYKNNVLFIRGIISDKEKQINTDLTKNKNIKIKDFLFQRELQTAILESNIIICRSGYSTIMDLKKLGSKAFFIPTPGQAEQEYLAQYFEKRKIAPFSIQENFEMNCIRKCNDYLGFTSKKIPKQRDHQFDFGIFN